jgi:L-aminopeptidase/D-esterase-like protein
VSGAVVYDLALGDPEARPDVESGYAACEAATTQPERGSVGVGTGCTVGKLLRVGWTKGGLGIAACEIAGGGVVSALAAVNAVGDVLAEDASVLAGIWRDGAYVRSKTVLAERPRDPAAEATTLVCVVTDATLTKTEAWLGARSAQAGLARAVDPVWTPFDGDTVFFAATNEREADPLAVYIAAADATAAAIRDGVRQATGAPGCPAASER